MKEDTSRDLFVDHSPGKDKSDGATQNAVTKIILYISVYRTIRSRPGRMSHHQSRVREKKNHNEESWHKLSGRNLARKKL